MGQMDIIMLLKDKPNEWLTINELSKELEISERNIRRAVIKLETHKLISGRCRGPYRHWNREFRINLTA